MENFFPSFEGEISVLGSRAGKTALITIIKSMTAKIKAGFASQAKLPLHKFVLGTKETKIQL